MNTKEQRLFHQLAKKDMDISVWNKNCRSELASRSFRRSKDREASSFLRFLF